MKEEIHKNIRELIADNELIQALDLMAENGAPYQKVIELKNRINSQIDDFGIVSDESLRRARNQTVRSVIKLLESLEIRESHITHEELPNLTNPGRLYRPFFEKLERSLNYEDIKSESSMKSQVDYKFWNSYSFLTNLIQDLEEASAIMKNLNPTGSLFKRQLGNSNGLLRKSANSVLVHTEKNDSIAEPLIAQSEIIMRLVNQTKQNAIRFDNGGGFSQANQEIFDVEIPMLMISVEQLLKELRKLHKTLLM